MYARRRLVVEVLPPGSVQHALVVDGDVAAPDLHGDEHVIGAQIGHQRVLVLTTAAERPMGPHRLAMAPGQELHAPVGDRRVVDRQPTRGRSAVVGVDPVGLVLMPGEHSVDATGLFRQELVEVEHHSLTAQLLGDRQADTFEDVALPVGVVAPRQHHVEDRVVGRVGAVLPRHHVVQVLARHVDLATHERVVDHLDRVDLLCRQDTPGRWT